VKRLIHFFKKLKPFQILTSLIAGFLLLTNTACNSGNLQGARPYNPPVQAGGNNNPHSRGGDGYTNFKASTDPKVNPQPSQRSRADLGGRAETTIAATIKSDPSDLIYPGSGATKTPAQPSTLGTRRERKLERQAEQSSKPQGTMFDTTYAPSVDSVQSTQVGPAKGRNLEQEARQLPKQPQPIVDRSDPNTQILEKVQKEFEDASAFIKDKTNEALERPEMQRNPALNQ
jgi:hypothetical protein